MEPALYCSAGNGVGRTLLGVRLSKLLGSAVLFFSVLTLLTEASRVIEIRLGMMAQGEASPSEMLLMVTEKIEAMQHAAQTLFSGGTHRQLSITATESWPQMLSACLCAVPLEAKKKAGGARRFPTVNGSSRLLLRHFLTSCTVASPRADTTHPFGSVNCDFPSVATPHFHNSVLPLRKPQPPRFAFDYQTNHCRRSRSVVFDDENEALTI